jgi:hypothetical protein
VRSEGHTGCGESERGQAGRGAQTTDLTLATRQHTSFHTWTDEVDRQGRVWLLLSLDMETSPDEGGRVDAGEGAGGDLDGNTWVTTWI